MAGLAAAGVDDAAAGRGRPRGPAPAALRGRGRRRRRAAQLARPRAGASSTSDPHRRGAAEAAAGGDRVGGVAVGRVAGFERRGEPALRPEAGALGERRAGDEADAAALLGGAQRRPESGGAAADDGDVVLGGWRLSPLSLSADRVELLAQPGRRRLRGRAPARRRPSPRPRRRAARPPRPASPPPRPGPRSRPAAPRPRRSPAPSPRARAPAPPRGASRSSPALRRSAALALEVGFERLDLRRRRAPRPLRRPRPPPQPPLGLLDLALELSPTRCSPRSCRLNLLRAGERPSR